jgi:5-methyltetrahydrofolate--homocysteine methyltransferase
MINRDDYYKAFLDEDQARQKIMACIEKNIAEGGEPLAVIQKGLIPALDLIGDQFSQGTLYIPELIFSGILMKECIEVLKTKFHFGGQQNLGTIVMGTVKGDMHDIGKNLVGMVAEASGFTIVDIGVDAPPERFVEAINTHHPQVVALSALLTTTMLEMKKTVGLIRDTALKDKPKIIVGGAPVTEKFAMQIGADAFGKDAVDGVVKIKEILGVL